jgi:hypothetical protein
MLEFEGRRTRSHSLENGLWKNLWTFHKTYFIVNLMGILNWTNMALYIKPNMVSSHEIQGSVYRVIYCTVHVPVWSTIQDHQSYINSSRTYSKNVGVHMPLTISFAGFLGKGWRGNLLRGEVLRTHYQACHIRRFRNIDIKLSCEYALRSVNIFETGVTFPGRAEASLAATASCRGEPSSDCVVPIAVVCIVNVLYLSGYYSIWPYCVCFAACR